MFLLLLCWEKNKFACSGIKARFLFVIVLVWSSLSVCCGVWSISSVRLLCLALLLLRGLVRLLFYCGLLCCSGLFFVAVMLFVVQLVCLLWFIFVAQVCVLLVVACFLLLRSVFRLLRFALVAVVLVLSSLLAYFFLCFAFSACCCVCAV